MERQSHKTWMLVSKKTLDNALASPSLIVIQGCYVTALFGIYLETNVKISQDIVAP